MRSSQHCAAATSRVFWPYSIRTSSYGSMRPPLLQVYPGRSTAHRTGPRELSRFQEAWAYITSSRQSLMVLSDWYGLPMESYSEPYGLRLLTIRSCRWTLSRTRSAFAILICGLSLAIEFAWCPNELTPGITQDAPWDLAGDKDSIGTGLFNRIDNKQLNRGPFRLEPQAQFLNCSE